MVRGNYHYTVTERTDHPSPRADQKLTSTAGSATEKIPRVPACNPTAAQGKALAEAWAAVRFAGDGSLHHAGSLGCPPSSSAMGSLIAQNGHIEIRLESTELQGLCPADPRGDLLQTEKAGGERWAWESRAWTAAL